MFNARIGIVPLPMKAVMISERRKLVDATTPPDNNATIAQPVADHESFRWPSTGTPKNKIVSGLWIFRTGAVRCFVRIRVGISKVGTDGSLGMLVIARSPAVTAPFGPI